MVALPPDAIDALFDSSIGRTAAEELAKAAAAAPNGAIDHDEGEES